MTHNQKLYLLVTLMAAWTAAATWINKNYAKPTAPKWKVIAYTLFCDIPAWYAAVGKTGLLGKLTVPGLASFTVTAPADDDETPVESPSARTKQAGFISGGWLLLIGALALGGVALLMSGCKTTYGAAYGSCVKASTTNWPETAAKVPGQVEVIMQQAAAGNDVAALLAGLADAYEDGGFLVSCALTAWTATHPLAGDGGLPTPALVAAHAGAVKFLAAHPAAAKRAASCARERL